jgi:hypothetical protein
MGLAHAADDAKALLQLLQAAEVRLAVAIAVVESDEQPDDDGAAVGSMTMNTPRQLPLVESYTAVTVFVEEVSAIVTLGSATHLTFAARQAEVDGTVVRVVQARLIAPNDLLKAMGTAILTGQVASVPVRDDGEPIAVH